MIDDAYLKTVRLLLDVLPDVFVGNMFAIKGGTAINLFVQDAPRLSVDIDLVYLDGAKPREAALEEIATELGNIASRLEARGLSAQPIRKGDDPDSKLLIMERHDNTRLKIEVNTLFRGSVLPVTGRQSVSAFVENRFGVTASAPILGRAELYASKMVAALDRQHPRDLFDVWLYYQSEEITDELLDCFVVYLAGHNRPPHEVLAGNDKQIEDIYYEHFVGMTEADPPTIDELRMTRSRLRADILQKLTPAHKEFLVSLVQAEPNWALLRDPNVADLPALRWKAGNLQKLKGQNSSKFATQAESLKSLLFRGKKNQLKP